MSVVRFCALVRNKPPPLKLPLLAAGGVTEPRVSPKKLMKILFVPEEGAFPEPNSIVVEFVSV